jgi:hypothetical protein
MAIGSEFGERVSSTGLVVYAMGMWKYILASIFLLIGILEIVLALHGDLREALMKTSPVRLKQAESSAFLFAGISALVMGIGILFYGMFW